MQALQCHAAAHCMLLAMALLVELQKHALHEALTLQARITCKYNIMTATCRLLIDGT